MKNRELVSSFFWLAVGVLFVIGALQQGLFRKGLPGPGFLPFLTALVFIFLSLLVLGAGLKKRSGRSSEKKKHFLPAWDNWKKILLAFFALVGYGFFLVYAGYIITTFFFIVFTLKVIEPKSWKIVFLIAGTTVLSTYILFAVLLDVQLPKGILEF